MGRDQAVAAKTHVLDTYGRRPEFKSVKIVARPETRQHILIVQYRGNVPMDIPHSILGVSVAQSPSGEPAPL